MVRRSPLRLIDSRVIGAFVESREGSVDATTKVEVAHLPESEVGYRVRLSFEGTKAASMDLDTFREIARAVESCVKAHHKRNSKAKNGKGKANAPESA